MRGSIFEGNKHISCRTDLEDELIYLTWLTSQVNLSANCAKQNEKQQNNKILTIKHSGSLTEKKILSSTLVAHSLDTKK